MAPETRRTVAVLGFGTMGAGIAQLVAQAGHRSLVLETDAARIEHGLDHIREFTAKGVERGKLTPEEREALIGRIEGVTDVAQLAGAELVIEAVIEKLDLKQDLLARVAAVVGEQAIIATNTSALSVSAIAAAVPRPERCAGLHFFHPAQLMKLVEVVAAEQSDEQTLDALEAFAQTLGKEVVRVKDRPGFLVNRLLMPYLNQVIQAYDDGLATAHDIDAALELGLGYPIGGLRLLDMIGLDTHLNATTAAYRDTFEPSFAPPPLLQRLVSAGRLGNKSGRGIRLGNEDAA
jgi:3-hydroxybutyryl-CoA dehydrogenase